MTFLVFLINGLLVSLSFGMNATFVHLEPNTTITEMIYIPNEVNELKVIPFDISDNLNIRRRLLLTNATVTCIFEDKITHEIIKEITINTADEQQCKIDNNEGLIPGKEYIISIISSKKGVAKVEAILSLSPTNNPTLNPISYVYIFNALSN